MQTHEFDSGPAALDWLLQAPQHQAPEVVLLDAQMPNVDGFEVATRIHALDRFTTVPLVMLSSAGMKGDAQRARDAGIAAYLTKPIAREDLVQILREVLNLQETVPQVLITRHVVDEKRVDLDVLLVEDNLVNQKLAVTLLQRWGHRVTVAENGVVALERWAAQRFDVILMDMMMPVMDGLEATRQIRGLETDRHIPIVAMTANAMESDRQRCLEAGMDDYIAKPIKAQELQDLLQRLASSMASESGPRTLTVPAALEPELAASSFDYADAMRRADQEILEIIAQPFRAEWVHDRQRLRDGLSGDLSVLERTAHALKGTLAMFGAQPASALAARLERSAQAGDTLQIKGLVDALIVEVERLIAAMP
jgi:hypothetical protein